MKVLVSSLLPQPPSPGEVGRRIVRHGLADVLAWLGEQPGPRPDEQRNAIAAIDPAGTGHQVLWVSPALYGRLENLDTRYGLITTDLITDTEETR